VLQRVNTRLLRDLGGSWSAPPDLEPGWVDSDAARHVRPLARAELARTMPGEPWVWKDPRLCLTLPWWEPLLADEPVIVLTHRNPLEIAASLERRNGFGIRLGLALWERYTRAALEAARGHRVATIDDRSLLTGGEAVRDRLRTDLVGLGVGLPPAVAPAPEPVDPSLRTATATRAAIEASPDLSAGQRALIEVLDDLPRVVDRLDPRPLPPETPWVAEEIAARRRAELDMRRSAGPEPAAAASLLARWRGVARRVQRAWRRP
jgi:hypothetical protein